MSFTLTDISVTISKQTGQARNSATLAFCVDENYLPYAIFVAEQFIHLHPDMPCDVCICLPDISIVPEKFINSQIRFIELSIIGIESLPVGRLSLAAYHRLFLPQVFRDTYKYIVYLDADTYINKAFYNDIMSCVDKFPTKFCVAAAADITELNFRSPFRKKYKKIDIYVNSYHLLDHIYRNSGILVFNTKNYNDEGTLAKIFTYAINNSKHLQCHDQSALNGALLKDIALLPFDFNWQIHKLTYKITKATNPYIIHFISDNKPWRIDNKFTKGYQDIYKEFLKNNFPDLVLNVLTAYEQRLKTPKYKNPIREFVSMQGQHLRNGLAYTYSELLRPPKNKYNSRQILIDFPFLVSSDIINNNKTDYNNP